MAEPVRKRIIANLLATIAEVPEVGTARYGSTVAKCSIERPSADLMPQVERRVQTSPGVLQCTLRCAIRLVVDDSFQQAGLEIEDFEAIIEGAVMVDRRRDALAQDTRVVGTDNLFNSPEFKTAGGDLLIEVDYRRKENDPTVLA
jgi:hypothetical protein